MPKHLSGPTPFDLRIKDAQGSYLYDESGKEYVDLLAGWCVGVVGWKNPRMLQALREKQPGFYLPPTVYNDLWDAYAEKLLSLFPKNLTKIFRSTSGSEAVEFALKLARAATGKKTIISFGEVYHGHTFGAASIGTAMTEAMSPGVGDIVKLNLPNEYRDPDGLTGAELSTKVLNTIEAVMKQGNVAAFISEGVWTNVGTIVPPEDFYPRLQELCRNYGVLLIMDEVASGFGRTGKMFAFEHWGLEPDIVCLGKGLTGGYSTAGATVCTEAIEKESHKIPRYSTFGWNLHDLVAMQGILDIMLEEKLYEVSAREGEAILSSLKPLEKLPKVGQVRGKGMLFSVEFVSDKASKEPLNIADSIMRKGFEAGFITETAASHILFFSPSLDIPREAAEKGLQALSQVIQKYCA